MPHLKTKHRPFGDLLKKILYWLPRVLAIAFTVFISLFALDVFSEGYSLGRLVVALFMHLIPTFLLVGILIIAWRYEKIGALLFLALSAIYTIFMQGSPNFMNMLLIQFPLLIIASLFWIHAAIKK